MYDPKQFRFNIIDELRVGSALVHESFHSVLILTKEPPSTEHSFPGDIFSKPELEYNKEENKLCSISLLKEPLSKLASS